MEKDKFKHIVKLPLDCIDEIVEAEPQVEYSDDEIKEVIRDLYNAVDNGTYYPSIPTEENPALSDDYIFDTNDEDFILRDLKRENFVGKIIDLSKGAIKRKARGFPQEYLYVFKYACTLMRRDAYISDFKKEEILIYIKINNRKTPYNKVYVVSFHKNRPKISES